MGSHSVVTNKLVGYDYPLTIKTSKDNLRFTLVFTLLDESFIPTINYNLGKIFGKSVPVPLELSEDRLKMIYVLPTNQVEITEFAGLKGYFSIDFQATTPYWLTPLESINNRVLKSGDIFILENKSNVQNSDGSYDVYPYLKFTVIQALNIVTEKTNVVTEIREDVITESGNDAMVTENSPNVLMDTTSPTFELIHISDKSNPNRTIKFSNLQADETIEMDSKLRQIKSSTGLNRFPNWNRELFKLHEGFNKFQTKYPVIIGTKIQYPIYR